MDAPLLLYTHRQTGELFRRRWRLIVVDGPDRGASTELSETPALVGAAPAASLMLTDDTVSRYHAEIDSFAEGLRIRDLDSTNGSFIGGEDPVRDGFVENGGTFRVGSTVIKLIALDEPAGPHITTDPELIALDGIVEIGPLVAVSEALRSVLDDVRRVAPSTSAVLLKGLRGVGKAAIARALHDLSDRRHRAFVTVDASNLPSDTFEEVLLGKGVRAGAFAKAHKGSLFVENVELLGHDAQDALKSAIRRGEVEPLDGRGKTHRVDVRILCSTTIDLFDHAGFDPELLRRLAVVQLDIPPLSERLDDAQAIATRRLPGGWALGPRATDVVRRRTYPNNVDDLAALVDSPEKDPAFERALLIDLMASKNGDVSAAAAGLPFSTRALFAKLASRDVPLDDL